MKKMVVIGLGNRIMQDDGIGTRVVECIKGVLDEHQIDSILGETDALFCYQNINEDDFLVIIDAMMTDETPGTVMASPLEHVISHRKNPMIQHEFSLLDFLASAPYKADGIFIGIEVASLDFGLEFSPILMARFPLICYEIADFILKIKEDLTLCTTPT